LDVVYDLAELSNQKSANKSALDILKTIHGDDFRYIKSTLVVIE